MKNQLDEHSNPVGEWDGVLGMSHYKGVFWLNKVNGKINISFTGYVRGGSGDIFYYRNGKTFGIYHSRMFNTIELIFR